MYLQTTPQKISPQSLHSLNLLMSARKEIEILMKISETLSKAIGDIHKDCEEYLTAVKQQEKNNQIKQRPPKVHFEKEMPLNQRTNKPVANGMNGHNSAPKPVERDNRPQDKGQKLETKSTVKPTDKIQGKNINEQGGQNIKSGTYSLEDEVKKGELKEKEAPKVLNEVKRTDKPVKTQLLTAKRTIMEKPKMPTSTFIRFNKDVIDDVRKDFPHLTQTDLVAVTGQMWGMLPEDEKAKYEEAYQKDKMRYDAQMIQYYLKFPDQKPKKKSKKDKKQ